MKKKIETFMWKCLYNTNNYSGIYYRETQKKTSSEKPKKLLQQYYPEFVSKNSNFNCFNAAEITLSFKVYNNSTSSCIFSLKPLANIYEKFILTLHITVENVRVLVLKLNKSN